MASDESIARAKMLIAASLIFCALPFATPSRAADLTCPADQIGKKVIRGSSIREIACVPLTSPRASDIVIRDYGEEQGTTWRSYYTLFMRSPEGNLKEIRFSDTLLALLNQAYDHGIFPDPRNVPAQNFGAEFGKLISDEYRECMLNDFYIVQLDHTKPPHLVIVKSTRGDDDDKSPKELTMIDAIFDEGSSLLYGGRFIFFKMKTIPVKSCYESIELIVINFVKQ